MSLKVIIPTPFRRLVGDAAVLEVEPGTVNELIHSLDDRYPGFRSRLCEDGGQLRRFLNIYIDGEDIRFLDNLATPIPDGAEVSIVPAIAGG
jgi:molybdopterin converting factor small subunit